MSIFQEAIFNINDDSSNIKGEIFNIPDGKILYYENFFPNNLSNEYFDELLKNINWKHEKIKMFGKEMNVPRFTAWYGDENKIYTYSGIAMNPAKWNDSLLQIKKKIEKESKINFNSVLLNLYRDGNDSVSWHSDDEPELGINPVIASISFGAHRKFQLRHKENKKEKLSIELKHGSLLLMLDNTQHFWEHQIPKTSKKIEQRINLTFREIK
ncbi:MAG: alpha-ketoglutarate-dependent dioxygenase AlkB [Bacteroidota bacterium]|nr:alpha-ketoglutarate-dependent dioxygenase AlkB [Bacteroidota bacterium]